MSILSRGHLVFNRTNLEMFSLVGETEGALFQVRIDEILEIVTIYRRYKKVWRKVCTLELGEDFDFSFDDEDVTLEFNRISGSRVQIGVRAVMSVQISRS